ncbi:hypothetical protein FIBSPDRAFT_937772 [Athelia psychrophila]|uniref:Uncharacterized protein n=1 Tax=Athelia psychrophila TaxID=1759441 RepID=A0A165ZTQ8_9AGAM|nr:hypothetical protein FIBSPDRAFT_937772 [Fibularhizoctonia sp. CBS 109695]
MKVHVQEPQWASETIILILDISCQKHGCQDPENSPPPPPPPTEFLQRLRDVYEQVVVEREQGDMALENEAFISMLKRRTISTSTGAVLFKLYDLEIPDSDTTPSEMVVTHDDARFLRMDCLRDGSKVELAVEEQTRKGE